MTQQEIKDNYAKSIGYEDFNNLLWDCGIFEIEKHYEKVIKLVAQQGFKNAAENVKLVISNYKANDKGICGWIETELKDNLFIINDGANIVASKSSITNPDNIPITI